MGLFLFFAYHFFPYIEQYFGIQLFTCADCQTKGTFSSTGFSNCFEVVDSFGYLAIIATDSDEEGEINMTGSYVLPLPTSETTN